MDKILYGSWIKRDKPIGAKVNSNFYFYNSDFYLN